MSNNLFYTESIEDIQGTAVVGGQNLAANNTFLNNANYWTAATGSCTVTLLSSGLSIVGSGGNIYQTLNTSDVVNGTKYVARVYCDTVSGTWKMNVGTSVAASDLANLALATGWNSAQFTAGAANIITLVTTTQVATDTLVVPVIEIRPAQNFEVTGDLVVDGSYMTSEVFGSIVTVNGSATFNSHVAINASVNIGSTLIVSQIIGLGSPLFASWGANYQGIQFGSAAGSMYSDNNNFEMIIGQNMVDNGTNYLTMTSGQSTRITMFGGKFTFDTGASTTQASIITFKNALTIASTAIATFASVVNVSGAATVGTTLTVTGSINAAGATFGSNVTSSGTSGFRSYYPSATSFYGQFDCRDGNVYLTAAASGAIKIGGAATTVSISTDSFNVALASTLTVTGSINAAGATFTSATVHSGAMYGWTFPTTSGAAASGQFFVDGTILCIKGL